MLSAIVYGAGDMSNTAGSPLFKYPKILNEQVPGVPNSQLEVHKINKLGLAVTNSGNLGTGYFFYNPIDPETGYRASSCEYPINSYSNYMSVAGLWIGAVVGRDTLVSSNAPMYPYIGGIEFWPDPGDDGAIERLSSLPQSLHYSAYALSEDDIYMKYTDTFTDPAWVYPDEIDNRYHIPLNIEIKQRSFGWSFNYAEDFILFDYEIRNIGFFPIKDMYFGIVVDPTVFHSSRGILGPRYTYLDDLTGFKKVFESPYWPNVLDTLNIAWGADNDGDAFSADYDYSSSPHIIGIKIIRPDNDSTQLSYNWWVSRYLSSGIDWGPRQVTATKPYRNFGPHFGSPLGDRNKYYILSTLEVDYDQLECAISHTYDGWLPPHDAASEFADGYDPIYVVSVGPFNLESNETVPVTMAVVAGENFHHNPMAFRTIFSPYEPMYYQQQLDFSDLALNALWAEWIFDNPGYDTDGDNDSGQAKWFYSADSLDSVYEHFKGDGVPDFQGASPPPPPELRVTTAENQIILQWNGMGTENYIDPFSKQKDFEGYKVYYAEDDRISDFILLRTFDIHNYNVFKWHELRRRWEVSIAPVTYDSLIKVYGPGFEPDLYTIDNPLAADDPRNPYAQYTYFTPQNWNESDLSNPYGIHKIYPAASLDDPKDTTEYGHRYYEYEYIVRDLPAGRPFFVAVTAFDYGSRAHRLTGLETSPLLTTTLAYAETPSEIVEQEGLGVYVYPNPYRISDDYAQIGFENRDRTKSSERARAIHFANLPAVCKIRIYTVSGDLVQEIDHYYPEGGPESMHDIWNVISKNTQAVVTGIYIWEVSSKMGQQLGKLVIIK
jgi:hypothetical protein